MYFIQNFHLSSNILIENKNVVATVIKKTRDEMRQAANVVNNRHIVMSLLLNSNGRNTPLHLAVITCTFMLASRLQIPII